MEFIFGDKELITLYCSGESRKLKLPKGVAVKFVERVNRIEAADTINDLRIPPSMRFEKLEGRKNTFSLRLTKEYRLEILIDFQDQEKLKGIVKIMKISKHYE